MVAENARVFQGFTGCSGRERLQDLFPGLREFCAGEHATLRGILDGQGIFARPYVVTLGRYLSGYHGGNRLAKVKSIPDFVYKFHGRGKVNPMFAIHNQEVTTSINLLNTHGELEADFWIDIRLYDQSGALCAERERWLLATRNGLARGEVADLLRSPDRAFIGHMALSFSPDDRREYPRILQMLCEYRTRGNTSRVMVWSDAWNSLERQHNARSKGIVYRSYFRAWCKAPIRTYVSLSNCGVPQDYTLTVPYSMSLINSRGEALVYSGHLAPHATDFAAVPEFFPDLEDFIGAEQVAMIVVESIYDLAIMQLSHYEASGVYAAEHFMSAPSFYNGEFYRPAGS